MRPTVRAIPYIRCLIFALLVMLTLCLPASSAAQIAVGVTVGFAPPDLPVYEQPICPGDGYLWTPGYWAWDDDYGDYYWVPGTWVLAPEPGFLWTPAYWAWGGSGFVFYQGYWGPVVGFYGGINYGFGYFGRGYEGGRWDHDRFYYNRAVNNVNVTVIHNVYNTTVINNNVTRVSYNGGQGGINERPRPEEERAAHERHLPPVAAQQQHWQAARSNPELRASTNHGKPSIAATSRPGAFSGSGVVQAREGGAIHGGPRNAGAGGNGAGGNNRENNRGNNVGNNNESNNRPGRATAIHPNELPPVERRGPPNTGNPKTDQKYQKQQDKMYAQQDRERQRLQQQQEKEHQQLARQNADDARRQQVEQRHQQQTQQMVQRHTEQQQRMEQRQPAPRPAPPREAPPREAPPKEKH